MVKLASPRVRITLEQVGAEDFIQYDVQTDNRDLVAFDASRGRHHWPPSNEAPMLWMTFLGWNALRRTGIPVPATFEDFNELCVQIIPLDENGDEVTVETATPDDMSHDADPMKPVPVTA